MSITDALRLAELGWEVFPLADKNQHLIRHGHLEASSDLARVERWWTAHPDALIGVRPPVGTVFVDLDTYKSPDIEAAMAEKGWNLPDPSFAQTTRSGGEHLPYATDGRYVANTSGWGGMEHFDTRTHNGYVVAWEPGEWRKPTSLTPAPEWLYDEPGRPSSRREGGQSGFDAWDDSMAAHIGQRMTSNNDITRWLGLLSAADPGRDYDWFLAALLAARADGRIVALTTPWTDRDMRLLARTGARFAEADLVERDAWWAEYGITYENVDDMQAAWDKAFASGDPVVVIAGALARVGARALGLIDRSSPPPLIVGRVSPDGHTIIFGPGDAGKGLTASSWITEHVDDGGRVLILDFEDHPEEWARRIYGLGGQEMLGTDAEAPIQHVSPLRHGKPNWNLLRAAKDEHRSSLVVVDSVAYAIPGTDPSDPQAATSYSAVIQPFGVPVLSLAHMNRMGDARYPFGSVFWHAGARITWSLVPDGDRGSKLTNRKHNNYEWQGAYLLSSDWLDGIPRDVYETRYSVTIAERIEEVLSRGPLELDDIVAAVNSADDADTSEPVKKESIRRTLARGLTATPQQWTVTEDVWSLIRPAADG